MTRRPARLTQTILNTFLARNEPLTGDLLEEFDSGRSQWWLFRQAVGASLYEIKPTFASMHGDINTLMLGAGLLGVLSLEVVMVGNLLRRFVFGPPLPTIAGSPGNAILTLTLAVSMMASIAFGFGLARVHDRHQQLSVALLTTGVFVSAWLMSAFTPVIQVVITAVFISGVLVGGRLVALTKVDATESSVV
jgi:hypothetical protein